MDAGCCARCRVRLATRSPCYYSTRAAARSDRFSSLRLSRCDATPERFYADFPMVRRWAALESRRRGPRSRRWVRQASLVINGARPFLPLQPRGAFDEWGMNWYRLQRSPLGRGYAAVVERGGCVDSPAPPGKAPSARPGGAGWRLFSDEFALIDPNRARAPGPRPISQGGVDRGDPPPRSQIVFGPEAHDTKVRDLSMRSCSIEACAATRASAGWLIVPFVAGRRRRSSVFPKRSTWLGHRPVIQLQLSRTKRIHLPAELFAADCYRLEYSDLDEARSAAPDGELRLDARLTFARPSAPQKVLRNPQQLQSRPRSSVAPSTPLSTSGWVGWLLTRRADQVSP